MNAYKFNGLIGNITRGVIAKELNIYSTDIYKTIKEVHNDGTIITKDGTKYKLTLTK